VTVEKWLGTGDRVVMGQSREPFQRQQMELPAKEMAKHQLREATGGPSERTGTAVLQKTPPL